MIRLFIKLLTVLAPVVLALAPVATAAGDGDFDSALEGNWCYIARESDSVRKRVADTLVAIDTRVKTVRRPSEEPWLRALHRRAPTEREISEVVAFLNTAVPASPLSRIQREAALVELTYADGAARRVCVNCSSRETVQSTAAERHQELVIATWIGGTLTIETNTNHGVSVLETYRIDRDSGFLNVSMLIQTPRLPDELQIRHVYAPAGKRKNC